MCIVFKVYVFSFGIDFEVVDLLLVDKVDILLSYLCWDMGDDCLVEWLFNFVIVDKSVIVVDVVDIEVKGVKVLLFEFVLKIFVLFYDLVFLCEVLVFLI